jgi:hypothetical protein
MTRDIETYKQDKNLGATNGNNVLEINDKRAVDKVMTFFWRQRLWKIVAMGRCRDRRRTKRVSTSTWSNREAIEFQNYKDFQTY